VKALIDHQPQARGRVRGVLDLAQPDLHEVPVIDQDMRDRDQDRDGERRSRLRSTAIQMSAGTKASV
jgi:hypothetical protein